VGNCSACSAVEPLASFSDLASLQSPTASFPAKPRDDSFLGSLGVVWPIWLVTWGLTLGAALITAAARNLSVAHLWQQYDSGWFLQIANGGYSVDIDAPAFYPLYPLLLRFVGDAIGGHPELAGFVLALPLSLAVFALLHSLAVRHAGEDGAFRAVFYLAVFPTAFFLCLVYSEALFLALAIAAFLAAERRRYLLGGVLAGASMLTRPLGVAVIAGLLAFALHDPAPRKALTRVLVALPVFALYPLLLVADGRSPLAFFHSEGRFRHTSFFDPLRGGYSGMRLAWRGVDTLTHGFDWVAALNVTALITLVAFAILTVFVFSRLGAPYGLYCFISLAMPVAAPADPWPYVSMQRFALALFPCFVVLGLGVARKSLFIVLTVLGATGLVFLVVHWANGGFVA
jgi:hypothetical protein